MQNSTLDETREQVFLRSLTYVVTGSFLISYANQVQLKALLLTLGIFLCLFSFVTIVVALFIGKFVHKLKNFDSSIRWFLFELSFMSFVLSLLQSSNKGYFELRFLFFFGWMVLILISGLVKVGVSGFQTIRKGIVTEKRNFIYLFFRNIAFVTLLVGLALLQDGYKYKEMPPLDSWLNNPFVFLGVALLCVFPIIIFTPENNLD